MTIRTTVRRTAAAIAVAGVAVGTGAFFATSASAAPAGGDEPTVFPCTSTQFTTKLVAGDAGAGNRYGALQFTANEGERCYLPGRIDVGLVGAHNVLIDNQADPDAPAVALSNGSSAYVQLHWTAIAGGEEQQTPNGITVTAPSDSNMRGDYIDPNVLVDWDLGAVDANQGSHTIDVGATTQGEAPTA
ncbi:DUF4232 domain-containing protein [Kibdelosporangium phytohabitans]|uniref:DUF4232 domain-containing protein n=1 Tax=Kibdelosporangium phytohabitans TaxID=860235 RepID=A0A0N9I2L3_9PSEU|nr:DUF4232 domain-containing protein [Kibdelosporangium phytohabitans]ALG08448.1 hypothetical protein AOZ06_17365 [Kibdelosporangium phytohabitans]MBE1470497.1 hypothetical protein [Kibdelosporangium phytohabitans]